ncbi:MAG: sensor domain-containing diguanylate cyclase [Sphingobium sp.]
MIDDFRDGTGTFCHLVQGMTGAGIVVAAEVGIDGRAEPVAASPSAIDLSFDLRNSRILDHGWHGVPMAAKGFRIPSLFVATLGGPASHVLYLNAPVEHAPNSGLLLLWAEEDADVTALPERQLPSLSGTLAALLDCRYRALRQHALQAQFSDLVESVPAGIVVIDGDGQSALVNGRAAEIFGLASGPNTPSALAEPMRAVRRQCVNADELDAAYRSLVANVDYAATIIWDFGDRQFEVDTHPIRGEGERGRIWLFNDVTAELRRAADLSALAATDPLTGVPNRRSFEERAQAIIARRAESGQSVAVAMIDVDHFKAINDTYGHPAGDVVLKEIARRCREALRADDLFARLGGEEFVALLPSDDREELRAVTKRLCTIIADTPVVAGGVVIDVRASLGVAIGVDGYTTLETLIASADEALYSAKQTGRNRVVFAGEA